MNDLSLADRHELENFLRKNNLKLTKKLGQNFLVDSKVLQNIVDSAELKKTDLVVEIGAGVGTLTRELAERAKKVVALEFDETIFPTLENNLVEFENVEAKNLDVRKFKPLKDSYKLVANIPYYLTSPILRQFFVETKDRPKITVLLIQKEVAEKICNPDKLSVLALQVRIFGDPEIICRVPKNSFLPPPKVESAVIKITLNKSPEVSEEDLKDFFEIVHAGFRAPRKKIQGSLAAGLLVKKDLVKKILKDSGIDIEKRPEDLSIQNWLQIMRLWRMF